MITSLKNKKVLVTGSSGFIGINLILELLKEGAIVTALDLPFTNWEKLPTEVKQVKADILNKKDLNNIFESIEIIYHLAAKTDLNGKNKNDYKANYEGTLNVLEEAAKNKTLERFIFYSTQLVVGLFNEKRYIDETEPYKTKTFYGESKIEGEKIVKEFCKKQNIPFTIIRPTSVYGPWGEAPYKEFFSAIKKKRYFHIGKADNLVSWVYVKNLVNLTLLASIHEKAINEIFFGNDLHPYSMRDIVNEVAGYYKIKIGTIPNMVITPIAYFFGFFKLFGFNVPIYPFRLRNMKMTYCYNIQKSLQLGYKPAYDLKSGIKETLDWYEEKNML